jgi:hypothetical protein
MDNQIISKLCHLYNTNPNAKFHFESLIELRVPKTNIDIFRRRRWINLTKNLTITESEAVEFYKVLETIGLGKVVVQAFPQHNLFIQSKSLKDYIQATMSQLNTGSKPRLVKDKPSQGMPMSTPADRMQIEAVKYQLSSGVVVEVTRQDIENLQRVLKLFD